MKLEHKVISLEWSQKLEKIGCPQDSIFYWVLGDSDEYTGYDHYMDCKTQDENGNWWYLFYSPQTLFSVRKDLRVSAYIPCEIADRLPDNIWLNDGNYKLCIYHVFPEDKPMEWQVGYRVVDCLKIWFSGVILANALAAMYHHLKEKGFLKSADIALSEDIE